VGGYQLVSDLSGLYLDQIKQHAADPVGFRQDIQPTHQHEDYNPLCGDRILLQLRIKSGKVEAAAFDGEACAICLASASLLCKNIPGHPTTHLQRLYEELCEALAGQQESIDIEALYPLLGVRPYPSRIRCATLPWSAACKAM
jgi:nitrogen fixation NifU-like protein